MSISYPYESWLMEWAGKRRMGWDGRERKVAHPEGSGEVDWIGRMLARVYDETAAEPIPDELLELLGQLGRGKPLATAS